MSLAYRIVYGVVGGYIAARLAPRNPMRHALALGVVGLGLSTAGAIGMRDLGSEFFPTDLANHDPYTGNRACL